MVFVAIRILMQELEKQFKAKFVIIFKTSNVLETSRCESPEKLKGELK